MKMFSTKKSFKVGNIDKVHHHENMSMQWIPLYIPLLYEDRTTNYMLLTTVEAEGEVRYL